MWYSSEPLHCDGGSGGGAAAAAAAAVAAGGVSFWQIFQKVWRRVQRVTRAAATLLCSCAKQVARV